MPKFKICLFFSDTGGGHRSAIDAVETAITELLQKESRLQDFDLITENIVEKSHPLNRAFVDLYNLLLRHSQSSMKYYHWFIQTFKPNDSEFGYSLAKNYLKSLVEKLKPAVIVSIHPMANQYLERVISEIDLNDRPKFLLVVTDPNGNSWRGWAAPNADLTIVPNALTKQQLMDWGVREERISVIGMPVHPDFIKPPTTSAEEFKRHLGLHTDRLTLCVNSGWAGGGNLMQIYQELVKVNRPIQVIFLCGHNRKLYEHAKSKARKSSFPTAVLPFHDRMADLMSAVDLMVTKAGGLTTFEAIARRLPIAVDMITPPMPQEMGTVEILIEQKLAFPVTKANDIVPIVENFLCVPDKQNASLPEVYNLDQVDAIHKIARTIVSYCDPSFDKKREVRPAYKHIHLP